MDKLKIALKGYEILSLAVAAMLKAAGMKGAYHSITVNVHGSSDRETQFSVYIDQDGLELSMESLDVYAIIGKLSERIAEWAEHIAIAKASEFSSDEIPGQEAK